MGQQLDGALNLAFAAGYSPAETANPSVRSVGCVLMKGPEGRYLTVCPRVRDDTVRVQAKLVGTPSTTGEMALEKRVKEACPPRALRTSR